MYKYDRPNQISFPIDKLKSNERIDGTRNISSLSVEIRPTIVTKGYDSLVVKWDPA